MKINNGSLYYQSAFIFLSFNQLFLKYIFFHNDRFSFLQLFCEIRLLFILNRYHLFILKASMSHFHFRFPVVHHTKNTVLETEDIFSNNRFSFLSFKIIKSRSISSVYFEIYFMSCHSFTLDSFPCCCSSNKNPVSYIRFRRRKLFSVISLRTHIFCQLCLYLYIVRTPTSLLFFGEGKNAYYTRVFKVIRLLNFYARMFVFPLEINTVK